MVGDGKEENAGMQDFRYGKMMENIIEHDHIGWVAYVRESVEGVLCVSRSLKIH